MRSDPEPPIPHGHWKTSTLVAGLTLAGIIAPYIVDGTMTGAIFLAYAQEVLAPALNPGDIVVMDNLSSHKVAGVRGSKPKHAEFLKPI